MEPHATGEGEGGKGGRRLRAPSSPASRRLRAPWSPTRQAEEKEERAAVASLLSSTTREVAAAARRPGGADARTEKGFLNVPEVNVCALLFYLLMYSATLKP
ncbi:hypothetical protein GUJ93_ZPchr0013g36482 [Zizania palustris]|uniref:Uncharacterized protein n=1 Tax=Zizania palustris TaxID=103762 RepID=A0A8J5WWP0_ZIZPA|nr:hypothetical protein GUJ93_ZPchr0013g36482 [Zizania palustris]